MEFLQTLQKLIVHLNENQKNKYFCFGAEKTNFTETSDNVVKLAQLHRPPKLTLTN